MNNLIEICVAIDISILGIAYPLLIDKISNIGQKYNSEYLNNVFDEDFPDNKIFRKISFFQFILIITLVSFIFQIFWIKPIKYFENNLLLENSADIILLILTGILTISFFYWVNKIMLFQGKASELLKFLISKYDNYKVDNQSKTYLLKSINEFAIFAIDKQDIHLQESLMDFYFRQFKFYQENFKQEDGAIYPIDLYNLTSEIITASVTKENNKLKALEHRASSGSWLLGESFKFEKISKDTYYWLWRNLVISSTHRKLISNYWSSASQFFDYSLSEISPVYENTVISNQPELDRVENERDIFLQLNYALGGLLFYQNEYNTLKYILSYSQSQPPSYPLLPSTMDEIFHWFDQFSNQFRTLESPIEYTYYFPEIDNLGISRNVSHNICLYISILFVRQFTQQTIYVYQNFKIFHNLTDVLQELYSYNNRLHYFRNCIEEVMSNKELLNIFDFKVNQVEVFKTFDELDKKIKDKINLTKLNAKLSEEKIHIFTEKTKNVITSAFDEYKKIENTSKITNVDENIISAVNGELIVTSKSSFTDNDIPNMNFESVYSQSIANNKIRYFIPNSFLMARTEKYLIERNQLLEGLERILKNIDNKIIIAIRLSDDLKALILTSKFENILIEIPSTNNQLRDVLFILDRNDLPNFESKDLPQEEINKFKLNLLDKNYKIYSNVIDINLQENISLKEKYLTNEENELEVLILISFILLIKWKKNRRIIMLGLTSPYREKGIANRLDDLKELITEKKISTKTNP